MQIINVKPKRGPADEETIPCGNCGERMDLHRGPSSKGKKGKPVEWVCRCKDCGPTCAPQLAMAMEVFRG